MMLNSELCASSDVLTVDIYACPDDLRGHSESYLKTVVIAMCSQVVSAFCDSPTAVQA